MKDNQVIMVALVCLTALEITALINGIDGVLFLSIVGAICGIVGYKFNAVRSKVTV